MNKRTATQRVGLRYIGAGAFYPGLPARDLDATELMIYAELIGEMDLSETLGTLYESVTSTDSATEEGANNA